ncbi:hypothetical protein [Rhodopseudomonas palustris]|uniref:hypothetical protein n=1 Tax=Rhodopseudomonas palustris TaxID=1076 RepID=UPI0011C40755|nr:hypothetical protein [Rhodopseudomonas palustris]
MAAGVTGPVSSAFRRASLIYPQPVAIACGRVLRARSPSERLDACLRAGEVLTRYIAAVALSSFGAREGGDGLDISVLEGNLAFGHFLSTAQQIANIEVPHPLGPYLAAGFKPKKGQLTGVTYAALEALLNLRNELGHQLQTINVPKAQSLLNERKPDMQLGDALKGVDGLLMLPLFVVEEQQLVQKVIRARRLLLMGESADPPPDEIEILEGVEDPGAPYIAVNAMLLKLPPILVWELVQKRANTRLLFLDKVGTNASRYKTVEGDEVDGAAERAAEIAALCAGKKRQAERVELRDGRHLAREWGERRRLIEETGARGEGLIPWDQLNPDTINWFVSRLTPKPDGSPTEIICERLLDGRTSINAHERRQLVLLFGTPAAAREELRRDVMDLQVITDPQRRWDDRLLIEYANLFETLRQAIEFLARNLRTTGLSVEGLTSTTGSPDYIAIREGLVNQFIHQDYADQTTCARVIIRPHETVLFNAGHSLVDVARLEDGGSSQARNPLVARAVRLVGFAEIAGSGLRLLHSAWRGAHRPLPQILSNREANNFTLTLDWRPLAEPHDELWHRLGVRLSLSQAEILRLVKLQPDATLEALTEASGMKADAVLADLEYLELQKLLECRGGQYAVAEHLREII